MGIGRQVRLLNDTSRSDYYSGEPTRRIPISIFYPTRETGSSHYGDLYQSDPDMLVRIYGEGNPDKAEYLRGVTTHFLNEAAPDRSRRCPVIVFSHGLEADRDFYLFLIESLVAEGYIVVTTGHLYDTDVTLLPDGEIVKMKPGLLGEASVAQRRAQIQARGQDMTFVVDHLAALDQDPMFQGMLDLDRVGLAGHSLGGMTVLKSLPHPLVKAAVMLDAALRFIDVEDELTADQTVAKPVLNFRRDGVSYGDRLRYRIERARDHSAEKFREIIQREHEDALADEVDLRQLYQYVGGSTRNFIYMDKTVHMTFCDWFRLVPDKYYPTLMPIDQAHALISRVVSAFFGEHLLGQGKAYTELINDSPLLHLELIRMS